MKTMKKVWMALLLFPAVLTSCLGGNSEPDPLYPGWYLFSEASARNEIALLPVDVAIRVAMMLGEAEAQGLTPDDILDLKTTNGMMVKEDIFTSSVSITREDTKFIVQVPADNSLYYDGTIEVDTHGNYFFSDDESTPWTISTSGLKIRVGNGYGNSVEYTYGDETEATISGGGSYYYINVQNVKLSAGNVYMLDGWHGDYTLTTAYGLAYNKAVDTDAEFEINGSGRDNGMAWSGTNAKYKGRKTNTTPSYMRAALMSGSFTGQFTTTDYDHDYFPSGVVKVEVKNNGAAYTVEYNGLTGNY